MLYVSFNKVVIIVSRNAQQKGTPPLVVAQCYQMGPGSKVDPLIMLNDAKRICDTLVSQVRHARGRSLMRFRPARKSDPINIVPAPTSVSRSPDILPAATRRWHAVSAHQGVNVDAQATSHTCPWPRRPHACHRPSPSPFDSDYESTVLCRVPRDAANVFIH